MPRLHAVLKRKWRRNFYHINKRLAFAGLCCIKWKSPIAFYEGVSSTISVFSIGSSSVADSS